MLGAKSILTQVRRRRQITLRFYSYEVCIQAAPIWWRNSQRMLVEAAKSGVFAANFLCSNSLRICHHIGAAWYETWFVCGLRFMHGNSAPRRKKGSARPPFLSCLLCSSSHFVAKGNKERLCVKLDKLIWFMLWIVVFNQIVVTKVAWNKSIYLVL